MFEREINLIGEDNYLKLKNSNILVIGVGGVGGYAVEEQKYTGKEYEVVYTDRTEIEFRSDGQWESVGRKYSPVPASIVPQPIQTFVSGSNYPGQFIRQIDRNAYTWEVELSNGLEIKFDNQFNVIDIDD